MRALAILLLAASCSGCLKKYCSPSLTSTETDATEYSFHFLKDVLKGAESITIREKRANEYLANLSGAKGCSVKPGTLKFFGEGSPSVVATVICATKPNMHVKHGAFTVEGKPFYEACLTQKG